MQRMSLGAGAAEKKICRVCVNFNLGRETGPTIIITNVNLQSKEAASNGVVNFMDAPKSESVIWERTNYVMERDIAC